MSRLSGLIERGLAHPSKIPRYVFGALFPSSRWGATWHERNGIVRFEPGGYVTSPRNRPEFAANLSREVGGLYAAISAHLDVDRTQTTALEVGCGYGRLAPWIARWADTYLGVDPDTQAIQQAATLYPALNFAVGRAESLPCADDQVALLTTWTVLQHIPEQQIRRAVAELQRVLAPGGLLVACERVRPPVDDHLHPRPITAYETLFEPLELLEARPRPVEPTWSESMTTERPPERLLVLQA